MTEQEIVEELIYRSYRNNRLQFPKIEWFRWKRLWGEVEKMEERFRMETHGSKALKRQLPADNIHSDS